jgi:phosphoglycerol transferase
MHTILSGQRVVERLASPAKDTTRPAGPPGHVPRAPYVASTLLCAGVLTVVLQLWNAELRAPLDPRGDAIFSQLFVKNLLETGWYTTNDSGAAPYGSTLHDFPVSEGLNFLIIRTIGSFTTNLFRVINWFYLVTFFLSNLTAVFALRWLGVRALPAAIGGLLFAFLPYHFMRFEAHLFLSAYYMVPPATLVSLWLMSGQLGAAGDDPWRGRRNLTAVLTAAAVSSTGVYYAFFSCFFFLVGGLGGFCRTGRFRPLVWAGGLTGVVCAGVILNTVPNILYAREHGKNETVGKRLPTESDYFSLPLAQLVLPRPNHRSETLKRIKLEYQGNAHRPPALINDSSKGASLGTVGLVGLGAILGAVLFRRLSGTGSSVLADLGALGVCGVLLGTIGGLGSLFAQFVNPQIRAWERVSIFLACFAVSGVVLLLDALLTYAAGGWRLWLGRFCCVALLAFGIWDQTSPADVPSYSQMLDEHRKLCHFVAEMEAQLPSGGMVYQLPFVEFPETPPVVQTTEYDHLRLLLRAKSLRFSHGAARGRPPAAILRNVSLLPPERMVDLLSIMGFDAIHVDRNGYEDRGAALQARLAAILGTPPCVCENGRDLFFPLVRYRARFLATCPREEVAALRAQALWPLLVTWQRPFDPLEEIPGGKALHWCQGPTGEVEIENRRSEPMVVAFEFIAAGPSQEPATLTLSGLIDLRVPVTGSAPCTVRVEIPPGRHRLVFDCPGEPLKAPGRDIYFGVFEFRARVENEHPLLQRIRGKDGMRY